MTPLYVVGGGRKYDELRLSLRSLCANVPHDEAWVAGDVPDWYVGPSIRVPRLGDRWASSTANLLAALRDDRLPNELLLMNDDFFVTQPLDEVPVLHKGPLRDDTRNHGTYGRGARDAEELLADRGVLEPLSYELHVPLPAFRLDVLPALEASDPARIGVRTHKRSVYANLFRLGGSRMRDVKVHSNTGALPAGPFASTNDYSLRGRAGDELRRLFPEPCRYERECAK